VVKKKEPILTTIHMSKFTSLSNYFASDFDVLRQLVCIVQCKKVILQKLGVHYLTVVVPLDMKAVELIIQKNETAVEEYLASQNVITMKKKLEFLEESGLLIS